MNLTPDWVEVFQREGWDAIHGPIPAIRARRTNPSWTGRGPMAALSSPTIWISELSWRSPRAGAPSIVQLRAQNVLPGAVKDHVVDALRRYEPELKAGALLTVDQARLRVRLLPIGR